MDEKRQNQWKEKRRGKKMTFYVLRATRICGVTIAVPGMNKNPAYQKNGPLYFSPGYVGQAGMHLFRPMCSTLFLPDLL
jgi:hypothetical protein